MEYDNTNTGALFKNETDNEKAPNYKGKINVEGRDWEIAAWLRVGKSGQKFMSLKLSKPFNPSPKSKGGVEEMDSDLPF